MAHSEAVATLPDATAVQCGDGPDPARDGVPIRMIVLDDSEFDRTRVARLVKAVGGPVEATFVASLADFEAAITGNQFDIAIVDYNLPEGTGLDAVRALRGQEATAETPTIMIAGEGRPDVAVSAIKGGCDDYITKDRLTPDLLRAAISNALATGKSAGTDAARQALVQEVMRAIDDIGVARLRPLSMRMLRHTRQLRRSALEPKDLLVLAAISESCNELHDFCEAFGRNVAERAGLPH